MLRFVLILDFLLFISCGSNQVNNKSTESKVNASASEHEFQIFAKVLSVETTEKKFRITVVIENNTGITSFSESDTVFLYPNYIRMEGQVVDMNNPVNMHMNSLQNIAEGVLFNAIIKIQGSGKNRYGLIMNWDKL